MGKKIALIHYSYPPIIGGVEILVREQAEYFTSEGYVVKVLAGQGISSRKDIDLVNIDELNSLKQIDPDLYDETLKGKVFSERFYERSKQLLKQFEEQLEEVDIIIVHNILTFTYNLIINHAFYEYAKRHPEKCIIAWTHDVSLTPERKRRELENKEAEKLFMTPFPNTHYVGISQFLKDTMRDEIKFSGNMTIIPNAVDIGKFLQLHEESIRIAEEFNLWESDCLILVPTKIMRHKNVDLSLLVLSELRSLFKNPKMIITAKGIHHNPNDSYIKEIHALVDKFNLKENVLFLDNMVSDEYKNEDFMIVKDLYKLTDIVFFFSNYENFGLPILEAGITKSLILCNDLSVFREIDSDNINLIDIEDDPARIATRVAVLLSQEKQTALFRNVKKKYHLKHVYRQTVLPLLEKLIEGNKR